MGPDGSPARWRTLPAFATFVHSGQYLAPDGHSRSGCFGNPQGVAGGIRGGRKGEALMADGEKAATAYTIGWEPQPAPQTAPLTCPVFEVFFGGARRRQDGRDAPRMGLPC
jgi:hypothetical protein